MGNIKYRRGTWWFFLIICCAYLSQLGAYGLLEPDEGRYAEMAREMSGPGGNWVIPHLDGVPHFQKPPVVYWLLAGSVKLMGNTEVAVRLPGALAALATLLLTMGIASRLFGARHALVALAILASSPLFIAMGRVVTPDMVMTSMITLAIYGLVRSRESARWGWLFFIGAGLGFLTKGPVAFLVPFSAALGWVISSHRTSRPGPQLSWPAGVPLMMFIGLSWHLLVVAKFPDLAVYFWKHELVERFASSTHGRSQPIWFFVPVLLAGFLPWTWAALGRVSSFGKSYQDLLGLFIGWMIIPFLVLSLSGSKLATYILPLFPGLAVGLAAALIQGLEEAEVGKAMPMITRWLMGLFMVGLACAPLLVTIYTAGDLESSLWGLWCWTALMEGAAIAWIVWTRRDRREYAYVALAILIVLGLLPIPSQLNLWNKLLGRQASVRLLAERIRKDSASLTVEPEVIACGVRAWGLPFYLERVVGITEDSADASFHGKVFPGTENGPVIYKSKMEVASLDPLDESAIFVLTRVGKYEKAFNMKEWEILERAGDFVLLRHQ